MKYKMGSMELWSYCPTIISLFTNVCPIIQMDQLLQSCHARNINLFVESFLKTIQKLLESTDSDLQILASKSFLHFSKIEEETPSYHRTYDFFIDRFR